MRELPPAPEVPALPRRPPLPPRDRYPERFKHVSEKQLALSEFHHLIARYVSGIPGSIYSLAFDERRAGHELPDETADVLREIVGLALQFKQEAGGLLQNALGLTEAEAEQAYQHFTWTHQLSSDVAPRAGDAGGVGEQPKSGPE